MRTIKRPDSATESLGAIQQGRPSAFIASRKFRFSRFEGRVTSHERIEAARTCQNHRAGL
jgi:hypothetical protein